jgi:hypothetical protein
MSLPSIVRAGAKVAAAAVGVLVALLLIWIGCNQFDRPLSANARAILTALPDPYPADDNLYIAVVGFDAPAGQSIIEAGEGRLDERRRMSGRLPPGRPPWAIGPVPRPGALEFNGNAAWLPSFFLWSSAKGHGAQVAALIGANRELYQRYLALHGLRGYFETGGSTEAAPGFMAILSIRRLFLASIAGDIQSGTSAAQQAAVTRLGQDLQLWKTVLDGTGGLLSKAIAAHALHVDLLLAGDMVTDPGCDLTFLRGEGDSLLAPFSLRNWQIGDAYAVEMRAVAPTLAALSQGASDVPWPQRANDWLGRQFFKLQATENLEAQRAEALRALADGDPATYRERRAAYDATVRRSARISLADLYDPVGKILMAIAAPAAEENLAPRVYDVAALQRLVFLAYQVRRREVPLAQLPQFMAQRPEWSTHPLGAEPFRWQPQSGRLSLTPAGQEPQRERFSLTLREPSRPPQHLCRG